MNRSIVLNLTGIFLLSLGVRTITAWLQADPINIDEAYHYVNAFTMANSGGFNEQFLWNYLYLPDTVSHPGFQYWMPLTSMIAAAGLVLVDSSYDGAQIGFVLLSSMLPLIAFGIALDASRNFRHANVVALLMIFSGFYFRMWTVTDSFTPFTVAGILSIYGFSKHLTSGKIGWALFAGLMTGLANLARPDAPLFLVAFLLILAMEYFRGVKEAGSEGDLHPLATVGALAGGFVIIMAPWYFRSLTLSDGFAAPGGLQAAWLCSYDDLFSYGKELTFSTYADCGWNVILQSKWQALTAIAERLYAEQGMIFGLPLAIVGWWKYRSMAIFRIVLLYGFLLLVSMSLIFTFPGPRGSWFHSAGVLLPFIFMAAINGADTIIDWLAKRWPGWRDASTKPFFSVLMVILAVALSVLMYNRSAAIHGDAAAQADAYTDIVAVIDSNSTVMVGGTTLFLYYGGWQSIAIPTNGISALMDAADRYSAEYLILDRNTPPAFRSIYDGSEGHPRLILLQSFGNHSDPVSLYRIIMPARQI